MDRLVIDGNDNYGKPRQGFANRIGTADDDEFIRIAEERIWLSAYADNNPRSDYHWQADACYDEAERRGSPELYARAYRRACQMT
jgi:hypothetical protein